MTRDSAPYFTPKCTVTKTAWYSIRPPVSTHDFGDASSCEVWRLQKGGLGRAQRAGAVAGAMGRA